MEWLALLYQILEVCIIPLLGVLTTYIIKYINAKSDEIKNNIDNDTADKYIGMLNTTITACVITTTETYVKALKKENAFTEEAQKEAFQKTYNAIMAVLSDEAKKYLAEIYGDLTTYITNRIETEVMLNK